MFHLNNNLITLKCVLFLFFGGLGCLFPFLPLHMSEKGLNTDEKRLVSIVSPCIALLGPAIAGPLADRLALRSDGKPHVKPKKYMRVMIAVCFIMSAILYWLLMAIPAIETCVIVASGSSQCDNFENAPRSNVSLSVTEKPTQSLICNETRAEILVKKCQLGEPCNSTKWATDGTTNFLISNCNYVCESDAYALYMERPSPPVQDVSESGTEYENEYDENKIGSDEGGIIEPNLRRKRDLINTTLLHIPHPHLCYKNAENKTYCQVYSVFSRPLQLELPLDTSSKIKDDNTFNTCRYPLTSNFHCRMGPQYEGNKTIDLTNLCRPVIKCDISNPITPNDSSLLRTACTTNESNFWWYLVIRSIADIFPAAAVALLDAAIIIATRETSTGRGDAGKQFAAGALGLALFAPIVGAIDSRIVEVSLFSVLMLIATLVILCDSNMPLSPPEWWWHTRCGLLAVPMASIRKYGLEIAALTFIVLCLGIFWNGVDPYLPWHFIDMSGSSLDVGFAITIGALPAVIFYIYIETIIDYCSHSNLLIASFAFYIIYYSALTCVNYPWLLLLCEGLDIFTLHIMWVTVVLYFRHLVPRKFTVSGQALLVIVHFCIARLIGALLGGFAYPRSPSKIEDVYQAFAIAAAVIAIIYFLVYHFYLKPKYNAPVIELEASEPVLIQSVNGNGTYSPLRVYYDSKSLKGQFKY